MSKEAAAAILTQTYFQMSDSEKQPVKAEDKTSSAAGIAQPSSGVAQVIRIYDATLSQLSK